jgi:hypothetical protein
VGLSITPEDHSPGLVRRQLARLLTEPAFAETAALAREQILKTPTPHELGPELLALA